MPGVAGARRHRPGERAVGDRVQRVERHGGGAARSDGARHRQPVPRPCRRGARRRRRRRRDRDRRDAGRAAGGCSSPRSTASTTVGAESAALSHARWQQLAAAAAARRRPTGTSPTSAARRTPARSPGSQFACACADAALAEVAPTLGDGVTEADVRDELEYRMRRHGADGPSYATIVASGPEHAARPHHETGRPPDRRGRHRRDRRRRPRRRLPLRHDPQLRDRRSDGRAAGALRLPARRPARRAGRGARRRPRPRRRRGLPRHRSSPPATATGTCTAPATASGC